MAAATGISQTAVVRIWQAHGLRRSRAGDSKRVAVHGSAALRPDQKRAASLSRRMGPENSATRAALFDAVERVLRNHGHAALSARRVAEEAGLNHQTVYYYFKTMDDLIIGTFRRRAQRYFERVEPALRSDQPLRALWRMHRDAHDARLSLEFNVLAARHRSLGSEVKRFLDRSRALQERTLTPLRLLSGGDGSVCPPAVAVMLIACVTQFLSREEALGFSRGHAELEAFVERCLEHTTPVGSSQ